MNFCTAEEIDEFLEAAKTIFGRPHWAPDPHRDRVTLTAALVSKDNTVIGNVSLRLAATLHTRPQRGSIALVCGQHSIQRMNIMPSHGHRNVFRKSAPRSLRGLSLPGERTRIYRWRANRVWPRPPGDNLSVAELVDPEPENFSAAVTLFLQECGISGELPPPPWEPRLI